MCTTTHLDYHSWGFRLEDVEANKIIMFAGGMDTDTPLPAVRYTRNRIENFELQIYQDENCLSLQVRYRRHMLETMRK